MRQFEDLKVIRQKEEQLEKKQQQYETLIKEQEMAKLTQQQIDEMNTPQDPYQNRSQARSPKKAPPAIPSAAQEQKKESAQQLESAIKENIETIEAKMRETQNKMKMLERERALMHQQHTKACSIF